MENSFAYSIEIAFDPSISGLIHNVVVAESRPYLVLFRVRPGKFCLGFGTLIIG